MSEQDLILIQKGDGIGRLTFNRPEKMNAFNNEMMRAAMVAMDDFAADEEVRVIIVTGTGRAFSAGFDLLAAGERKLDSVDKVRVQMALQFDFIMKFWDNPKPTIAEVHGYCLAGAFEVSLACDITMASDEAIFGEPEVRFGTGAVAMLLPWVTGPKQAKELMLSGEDRLPAREALRLGLVNQVVETDQLSERSEQLARKIARASAVSVQLSKQAINRSYEIMGMRQALLAGLDLDVEINATPSWEKQEFARIRKEQGVKAAIAWRDGRFTDDL